MEEEEEKEEERTDGKKRMNKRVVRRERGRGAPRWNSTGRAAHSDRSGTTRYQRAGTSGQTATNKTSTVSRCRVRRASSHVAKLVKSGDSKKINK